MRASNNSPSVLSGILLSSQPEQVQVLMLYLALLHPGRQFHSSIRKPQVIHHHRIVLTGYLFCSVASRLRLIIANSGACSEGGVSSLSSDPPAGSHADHWTELIINQALLILLAKVGASELGKVLFF